MSNQFDYTFLPLCVSLLFHASFPHASEQHTWLPIGMALHLGIKGYACKPSSVQPSCCLQAEESHFCFCLCCLDSQFLLSSLYAHVYTHFCAQVDFKRGHKRGKLRVDPEWNKPIEGYYPSTSQLKAAMDEGLAACVAQLQQPQTLNNRTSSVWAQLSLAAQQPDFSLPLLPQRPMTAMPVDPDALAMDSAEAEEAFLREVPACDSDLSRAMDQQGELWW